MAICEENLTTAFADAFKKINLEEVKLVDINLDNGLTLAIINTLTIGTHAKKRYKERFNADKNNTEIDIIVRETLKKSNYVGLVPSSDGNESHLYVYDKMGIHISTDFQNVNTIVNYGANRYLNDVLNYVDEVKNGLIEIQMKQMKKLTRKRNSLKKRNIEDKLNGNVRIAELERLIYKTKSQKAKQGYIEEREQLIKNMQEQETSLIDVEHKIRKVGGALAFLSK